MRQIGLMVGALLAVVGIYGCTVHSDTTGQTNSSGQTGMSGGKSVTGSGTLKSESRSVSDFDSVTLSGFGKVVITQSGKEALTVTADDNILPLLQTRVVNGTLRLEGAPGVSLNPTKSIEFDIDVKKLKSLNISGAGDIQANRISGEKLAVLLSGAGNVTLSGQVTELRLTLSGAGNLDGAHLQAHQATVDSSGVGAAVVNAGDRLTVNLSGVGNVEYIGSPQVQQNVSGFGKVTQRR